VKEFTIETPIIKNWNSHNILHMKGVGVKLKRDAKIFGVWRREKGV